MAKDILKDLIYGEQLVSDGCQVIFAVGLTYSLDLEALLTVPLAFSDLGDLDSSVRRNPAYLLEGIRRASEKFVVFCNKGSIHVPQEARTIFSLMESSIVEVQNKDKKLRNFHPKLWLVKEKDSEGKTWLKLSVMSRNLTFSNCLDICCTLRGRIMRNRSRKGTRKHQPLKKYLLWLSTYTIGKKAKRIQELAEQLDYVEKFELESPFQSEDKSNNTEEGYTFHPFSFEEYDIQPQRSVKEALKADRILVVSPFIDAETLKWITSQKKNLQYQSANSILITRKEFVTEHIFNLFEEVWVPNDTMIDNTTANIDLHAKMYLTHHTNGPDTGYALYLGSANATCKAFNDNAEFLLQLKYKRTTKDRIKEILDEFTEGHKFIKMDAPNPEATEQRYVYDNEKILKKAMKCLKQAVVIKQDNGTLYSVEISVRDGFDKRIKIRPLQYQRINHSLAKLVTFKDLDAYQLSEFYILSIPEENKNGTLEIMIKVDTKGLPKERDEAIYQSVVTRKEELLDYVSFMLCENPLLFISEQQIQKKDRQRTNNKQDYTTSMPLFENLLRVAVTNPTQIKEVIEFVNKMKQEIVPDELKQILTKFESTLKYIKGND